MSLENATRGFRDTMGEPATADPSYGGPERRDGPRVQTDLAGKIVSGDGFLSPDCVVIDLSASGARVRIPSATSLPPPAALLLVRHGLLFDAAVAWRRGDETGLVFTGRHDLREREHPSRPGLRALWLGWSQA